MKCKSARAVVLVRQREPLCQACLEAGVSGKVRALKSNKLLLPGDQVVLAFSGGFSSQTLLRNILAMRKDASTPRKERGKIEFGLSVVHINEATAHGLSAAAAEAHGRAVVAAAQRCGAGGPAAAVRVVPLSDVFLWLDGLGGQPGPQPGSQQQQQPRGALASAGESCHGAEATAAAASAAAAAVAVAVGSRPGAEERPAPDVEASTAPGDAAAATGAGREETTGAGEAEARAAREARLQALLQSVPDPTGREDLVRTLRTRLLAAVAGGLGAAKVLRGDTATVLAARIISDTAKGRGYSLPGGIQLLDARGAARGEPAVLQPMREVTLKEAVFFCRLRGLEAVQLPYSRAAGERRSVNALAASFVDSLQANLPSTIFTILRTAAALKPFPFNSSEALAPSAAPAAADAAASTAVTARVEPAASAAADADAGRSSGAQQPGNGSGASECQGLAGRGDGGTAVVSCCVLCRAPLTRREREAIAAAAAARSARQLADQSAAAEERGLGSGRASPGEPGPGADGRCGSPSLASAAATGAGVEQSSSLAVAGDEAEQYEDELEAPFCISCRSQILFTPEQSAGTSTLVGALALSGSVGFAGIARSKTLAVLPAAFR
ncbi:hypothetical protein PLESTB_001555300 [Pleodorina starrii]|uniref:Cytoplasmic tRNA 2-thiolation protein 2 n=1 Tax=Pleodorina starrii TaxID=330485 RepID=A0A9W6BYM1_9CHLO|nr:hypothetical protein PLESTB_001555300 [Pleodorina starrii]